MKKISFFLTVFLTPGLSSLFSYLFLEYYGLRPLGISITFTIKDTIILASTFPILYFFMDSKINEAIKRFEEKRKSLADISNIELISQLENAKEEKIRTPLDETADMSDKS